MSVDTVNYALTTVRMRHLRNPESFSPEGQRKLLGMCDCMRANLMAEDVKAFDDFVDDMLARETDAADFLLEELFDELGIQDRDELSAALAA